MTTLWRFRSWLPIERPVELRRALLDGCLYAPCADDFNDPYDCLPAIEITDRPIAEQQQKARQFIRKYDIRSPYDDILMGAADKGILNQPEYFGQVIKQFLNEIRKIPIMSFFPSADCPAMWAYYGNSGTGYVLGLDFSTNLPNGSYPLEVIYKKTRPIIDFSLDHLATDHATQQFINECFLIKHEIWDREQEHRLTLQDSKVGYIKLGQDRISDICFGWKADPELINEIKVLKNQRKFPLNVSQVVCNSGKYGLQIVPVL